MFHRAPPEVNGLGVITSTPGLVRSSQVRMFLGLPGRTAKTTTESRHEAVVLVLVPASGRPGPAPRGGSRRARARARRRRPAARPRPRGSARRTSRRTGRTPTPLPSGVFCEGRDELLLVGLLGGRVRDEREALAALTAAGLLTLPAARDEDRDDHPGGNAQDGSLHLLSPLSTALVENGRHCSEPVGQRPVAVASVGTGWLPRRRPAASARRSRSAARGRRSGPATPRGRRAAGPP